MKLIVKLTSGVKFSTEFAGGTVLECKQHLHSEHSCAIPSQQRLIYKGRILEDAKQLEGDYQVVEGATLFLVSMKDKTGAAPKATPVAAAAAAPQATAAATPSSSSGPSNTNPLPTPQLSDLMQQMSQMQAASAGSQTGTAPNAQDMDPMQALGQNPFLQNMINENPEMITNMLQSQLDSNPALRELMDSNPMVREVLQDPAALRNMMQAAAHPDVRAQQQRHHDLALANIENMPGGFNLLRSMYENVQAPLEEAAAGGGAGSTTTNSTTNPSNSTAGASGQAMPNPWGSNNASSANSGATSQQNPLLAGLGGGAGANPFMGAGANPFLGGGAGADPFAGMGAQGLDPSNPEQRDAAINALESNPQLQQMMQQFATQQPGMIRQLMAASNPAAAQMLQGLSDEQLGSMMQMAMQPNMLRMMQRAEGAGALGGLPFAGAGADPALIQGIIGGGGVSNAANNPWAQAGATPTNPTDRYRPMLEQMRAMGFDNDERSLNALQRAHGNLNRAVDFLLEDPPQDDAAGSSGGPSSEDQDSSSP